MQNKKKATMMRRAIAKNMVNSWNISPKCDFVMRIDATAMMDFKKNYSEHNNCKISYLGIVMKACAIAITDYPIINSMFDYENMEHVFNDKINVGFAMAYADGLVVANVKNSDSLSLAELCSENEDIIRRVKEKKLTSNDMHGGSVTINNMGAYSRLEQHSAIINQPELCIVSMYCIKDRPVVQNGELTISKTMNLAISADHRVIDGKLACEFLEKICTILENPEEFIR